MFHYPFHVGDYIADTAHLTLEEDIAYRRLLDLYYTTELPIPDDPKQVARRIRMPDYTAIVGAVLAEFFTLDAAAKCWRKSRCDDEISKYQGFSEAGKRGAEKRWHKVANGPVDSPPNGNQEPRTENQEPVIDAKASLAANKLPPCPHARILELYQQHLPHLMQPRSWEGARQTHLKNRWIQASKPSAYSPKGYSNVFDGLDWWSSFFEYIAKETKLAQGFESNGRSWKPDLEWIVNASNFAKIIDGKYNK